MTGKWGLGLLVIAAVLVGTTCSPLGAQEPKKTPKKEAKKPPKELKIEVKKEVVAKGVAVFPPPAWGAPIGVAYGYWPGPVLPGMWGGVWGGLWPDSWWMGGPYLYSGWVGPWGGGYSTTSHGWASGAWPTILPPVFAPRVYPAVSPYWLPRVAPYWIVPGAAPPVVLASNEPIKKPARAYRPVPAGASAERLHADAQWLFWEDNFESARDHLAAAVKLSPSDARLWYLKALAERSLGDEIAARKSAENGAALEILGASDKRTILVALERIQGPDRKFLTDFVSGSKAISVRTANEIVAQLQAADRTTLTTAR
jgi:hypothetical protein